jgi:hypothetical protein
MCRAQRLQFTKREYICMPARRHRIPFEYRHLRRSEASVPGDPARKPLEIPAETFGIWINMYATNQSVCNSIQSVRKRLNERKSP